MVDASENDSLLPLLNQALLLETQPRYLIPLYLMPQALPCSCRLVSDGLHGGLMSGNLFSTELLLGIHKISSKMIQ